MSYKSIIKRIKSKGDLTGSFGRARCPNLVSKAVSMYSPSAIAPERCASICDVAGPDLRALDLPALLDRVCGQAGFAGIDRIYAGSYFCDRFFLALPDALFDRLAAFCAAHDVCATLVVPIFSQANLVRGCDRVESLLKAHPILFDEVTVNDAGAARRSRDWCARFGVRCNAGRLFSRDPRDPRYRETSEGVRACRADERDARDAVAGAPLGVVEIDPFAPVIDVSSLEGASVALHLPHCFMSTGRICEAASTGRAMTRRYRPNAPCALECLDAYTLTVSEGWETMPETCFAKMGRTVFFENPSCAVVGGDVARVVWTPSDFRAFAAEPRFEGEAAGGGFAAGEGESPWA